MQEIRAEIEIAAPAECVWQVFIDFARYPEWNPFIPRLVGEAKIGTRLDVQIQLPGGRALAIRPTVLRLEPNRAMMWIGRLGLPGIFTGQHHFEVESRGPERTTFIQHETFTGLLVPPLLGWLGKSTKQGFEAMNQALKVRAEKGE